MGPKELILSLDEISECCSPLLAECLSSELSERNHALHCDWSYLPGNAEYLQRQVDNTRAKIKFAMVRPYITWDPGHDYRKRDLHGEEKQVQMMEISSLFDEYFEKFRLDSQEDPASVARFSHPTHQTSHAFRILEELEQAEKDFHEFKPTSATLEQGQSLHRRVNDLRLAFQNVIRNPSFYRTPQLFNDFLQASGCTDDELKLRFLCRWPGFGIIDERISQQDFDVLHYDDMDHFDEDSDSDFD